MAKCFYQGSGSHKDCVARRAMIGHCVGQLMHLNGEVKPIFCFLVFGLACLLKMEALPAELQALKEKVDADKAAMATVKNMRPGPMSRDCYLPKEKQCPA